MSRSACTRDDGVPKAKQDTPYKLKPDTEYTVRMATLSLDDPLEDEDTLTDAQLRDRLPDIEKIAPLLLKLREKECQVTFWTFPAGSSRRISSPSCSDRAAIRGCSGRSRRPTASLRRCRITSSTRTEIPTRASR